MPGGGSRAGAYVHQMEARHVARRLSQPMRIACGLCDWSVEDTVPCTVDEDASKVVIPPEHPLELARAHRRDEHGIGPWRRPLKTPGRNLSYIRSHLSEEEQAEIDEEIARRARLHGIEVEACHRPPM
jgi:hypothetical protein